jgi:3-deoxy-D-manno-octulosonic-acid transferase
MFGGPEPVWRSPVYLLYDLILLISAFFLIPFYLIRGVRHGKVRRGIRERLGFFLPERLAPLRGRRVFWIHAVSVGETRAAISLLKGLRKTYPEAALVLSNVTETGHAIANEIKELDLCLFFPFDLSLVVKRVLRQVRPDLVIIVETEIWPNFVRISHESGIPILLVNGRISDRSFPRYRLAQPLLKPLLQRFSAFCMQTELDAERIRLMGAPEEKVEVTRNLKFDMQTTSPDRTAVTALKDSYRIPPGVAVWVAGSTHAGEEEIVIDVYRQLVTEGENLILILVPRHPERCRAVGDLLASRGLPFVPRSEIDSSRDPLRAGDVLLGDTLGEMLKFYAAADVVFVGGSLTNIGGHNILEACLLKKPVLFGPHMHNFKEISRLVAEVRGGIAVADGKDLLGSLRRLIANREMRRTMGEAGYELLQRNSGATAQTLSVIRRVLG